MVDEPELAVVPQKHIGVAPCAVDVGDKGVEPDDAGCFEGIGMVDGHVPRERAGEEVEAEVESAARLKEILNLLVAFGAPEVFVEVDKYLLGYTEMCGACELASYKFGYQCFGSMSAAPEFQDVLELVIGVDKRGERSSLAKREDVADGGDSADFIHECKYTLKMR